MAAPSGDIEAIFDELEQIAKSRHGDRIDGDRGHNMAQKSRKAYYRSLAIGGSLTHRFGGKRKAPPITLAKIKF